MNEIEKMNGMIDRRVSGDDHLHAIRALDLALQHTSVEDNQKRIGDLHKQVRDEILGALKHVCTISEYFVRQVRKEDEFNDEDKPIPSEITSHIAAIPNTKELDACVTAILQITEETILLDVKKLVFQFHATLYGEERMQQETYDQEFNAAAMRFDRVPSGRTMHQDLCTALKITEADVATN